MKKLLLLLPLIMILSGCSLLWEKVQCTDSKNNNYVYTLKVVWETNIRLLVVNNDWLFGIRQREDWWKRSNCHFIDNEIQPPLMLSWYEWYSHYLQPNQ